MNSISNKKYTKGEGGKRADKDQLSRGEGTPKIKIYHTDDNPDYENRRYRSESRKKPNKYGASELIKLHLPKYLVKKWKKSKKRKKNFSQILNPGIKRLQKSYDYPSSLFPFQLHESTAADSKSPKLNIFQPKSKKSRNRKSSVILVKDEYLRDKDNKRSLSRTKEADFGTGTTTDGKRARFKVRRRKSRSTPVTRSNSSSQGESSGSVEELQPKKLILLKVPKSRKKTYLKAADPVSLSDMTMRRVKLKKIERKATPNPHFLPTKSQPNKLFFDEISKNRKNLKGTMKGLRKANRSPILLGQFDSFESNEDEKIGKRLWGSRENKKDGSLPDKYKSTLQMLEENFEKTGGFKRSKNYKYNEFGSTDSKNKNIFYTKKGYKLSSKRSLSKHNFKTGSLANLPKHIRLGSMHQPAKRAYKSPPSLAYLNAGTSPKAKVSCSGVTSSTTLKDFDNQLNNNLTALSNLLESEAIMRQPKNLIDKESIIKLYKIKKRKKRAASRAENLNRRSLDVLSREPSWERASGSIEHQKSNQDESLYLIRKKIEK